MQTRGALQFKGRTQVREGIEDRVHFVQRLQATGVCKIFRVKRTAVRIEKMSREEVLLHMSTPEKLAECASGEESAASA